MTDIKIQYGAFKKLVKKTGNIVFESAEYLVTTLGALTVWTTKRSNEKRVYPDSLPYEKIGYLSISGSDVKKLPRALITDIEEMTALIDEIPTDEVSQFVTALMKHLEESGLKSEAELGLDGWMNPEGEG